MDDMKIESPAFQNNQNIPAKYTCDGNPQAGGINHPLKIFGVPKNTKSLAPIVDDPDAPVEKIPTHAIASAELVGLYKKRIS